ncbi:MAG: hypothetical protein DGJ47_000376 [Rickettsiaceae bacterium]
MEPTTIAIVAITVASLSGATSLIAGITALCSCNISRQKQQSTDEDKAEVHQDHSTETTQQFDKDGNLITVIKVKKNIADISCSGRETSLVQNFTGRNGESKVAEKMVEVSHTSTEILGGFLGSLPEEKFEIGAVAKIVVKAGKGIVSLIGEDGSEHDISVDQLPNSEPVRRFLNTVPDSDYDLSLPVDPLLNIAHANPHIMQNNPHLQSYDSFTQTLTEKSLSRSSSVCSLNSDFNDDQNNFPFSRSQSVCSLNSDFNDDQSNFPFSRSQSACSLNSDFNDPMPNIREESTNQRLTQIEHNQATLLEAIENLNKTSQSLSQQLMSHQLNEALKTTELPMPISLLGNDGS